MQKAEKKKAAPSSSDSDSGPDDRAPVAKKAKKSDFISKAKSFGQKDAKTTGDKMKAEKKKAAPSSSDSDSGPDDRTPVAKKAKKNEPSSSSGSQKDSDGNTYFELDETKRVTISAFKGKIYVNIRQYYSKDGKMLPGKGIALQPKLWKKLLEVAGDVNKELESK